MDCVTVADEEICIFSAHVLLQCHDTKIHQKYTNTDGQRRPLITPHDKSTAPSPPTRCVPDNHMTLASPARITPACHWLSQSTTIITHEVRCLALTNSDTGHTRRDLGFFGYVIIQKNMVLWDVKRQLIFSHIIMDWQYWTELNQHYIWSSEAGQHVCVCVSVCVWAWVCV